MCIETTSCVQFIAISKTLFVCQNCGSEHRKWAGQCPDCNEWNCITEQSEIPITARVSTKGKALNVISITEISTEDSPRHSTGIDRFNAGGEGYIAVLNDLILTCNA